jgi:hypothetical protein
VVIGSRIDPTQPDRMYSIDLYDIALAYQFWMLGKWDIPLYVTFSRTTECGLFLTEICAGTRTAYEFIDNFIIDPYLRKILSKMDALAWISEEF